MKVVRTTLLEVGELEPAERARLASELTELFLLSYEFENREMFAERVLFRTPDTRLTLLYDRDDHVIGFNTSNIEFMELDGQQHAVLRASVYNHPELRGGGQFAARRVFLDWFGFKLRHPLVPLCLIGEAATPAGYARVARHFPIHHPRPDLEIPASITALVRQTMGIRDFPHVDDDPWRVHLGLPFAFREPERLEEHAMTSEDPAIEFYVQRNPGFLQHHWLVVYVPLDLAQLRAMLENAMKKALSAHGTLAFSAIRSLGERCRTALSGWPRRARSRVYQSGSPDEVDG